jgi:hypothetical protein
MLMDAVKIKKTVRERCAMRLIKQIKSIQTNTARPCCEATGINDIAASRFHVYAPTIRRSLRIYAQGIN